MFGTREEDKTGTKTVSSPLFEQMMEHLAMLSEIHSNITPQGSAAEEVLDIIEARMLRLVKQLPEGQV